MPRICLALLIGFALLGLAVDSAAQEPPSYAKQVKPFLARYCLECHNADEAKGGLILETLESLIEGGQKGPVLASGKPDESRLVLMVEGKMKPAMPPQKAKQPKPSELAVLRNWVAAGAKDDSASVVNLLPDIKPRVPVAAPIRALAYHPQGKLLAAGVHKEVLLLDVSSGDVLSRLMGPPGLVTTLAFSRDGQRLAVGRGTVGRRGEVHLYALAETGLPQPSPARLLAAHRDLLYDLAFSPDGKTLATCGYDRLIKLWDVANGTELRTLKDHSDAVYGVAFSPDGRLLASAAADRAVKIWDVATGKRLYTLGDATDWLYAVAWSPDGKQVAAAGVDRSLRVWDVSAAEGKLVRSIFAHEGPVTRLIYAADGKTLYSLSEDRTLKAWDTARWIERKVYTKQPEAVLSLAVQPVAQPLLALGRYDGTALLLDGGTGQVRNEPLPVKPKPPQLAKLTPNASRRGQTVRLTLEGKYLETVAEITSASAEVTAKIVPGSQTANQFQADITIAPDAPAGAYKLGVKGDVGKSATLPFLVDLFSPITEIELNDSPSTGQKVTLPATLLGAIGHAGDVDYYRFEAQAGQQIGVEAITSAADSKLEPILQLCDTTGRVLVESSTGVLGYTCSRAGTYALGIRDRDFRGNADMHYRLHVGEVPVVTSIFPLGLQRGTEASIHLEGVNLGGVASVTVKAPAEAPLGSQLPVPVVTPKGKPVNLPKVAVGEFPAVQRHGIEDLAVVPVPGTADGRLAQPGARETWRFRAHKGQRLILEVQARRLGSPLDSHLEVLDDAGQLVPRAVLRCLAKTYTTFRDHDATSTGIRIEAWNELAINDDLLIGNELVRIFALPKNPDDDCQFFSRGGQRVGQLDTTPTFHSLGTPMYKVAMHPPGTTFPPNGLPVVTLYYRNDDGGSGFGKDSHLFFDPPADGEYQVRIGDAHGQGGPNYAYRLTVRPPRPSFQVRFNPTSPTISKGSAVPITVSADRSDGFEGTIAVHLTHLPAGLSAPTTAIPSGENSTAFALWADVDASLPASVPPLKLVARATIDGQEVLREVTGGMPKLAEPGDLVTTAEQSEVTVLPGREVRLSVQIERRQGFAGRVPIEVRGLPHGVRVLDIGLNGILITERETRRTFVIYAEPWVEPMEHPFVILARREGKGTEYAAKSVLLKVAPPRQ
jgi:WD40 repeat protein